jgi:hypothetical protein
MASHGGVCFAITLDGAELSRNVGHVTAGVKMIDPRAIDPRTKLPIGVLGGAKIQSREVAQAGRNTNGIRK